jgi:hypothetical protein
MWDGPARCGGHRKSVGSGGDRRKSDGGVLDPNIRTYVYMLS